MNKSCNSCGFESAETAKFCLKCGASFPSSAQVSSVESIINSQQKSPQTGGTPANRSQLGSASAHAPARRPPPPPPPPPPPVSNDKPAFANATIQTPVIKSKGSGGKFLAVLIVGLLVGGAFWFSRNNSVPSGTTSTTLPIAAPVAIPEPTSKEDQIAIVPIDFSVDAPGEARKVLTSMIVNAMNPMRLAEYKGILEALPKPVTGDRKTARALNEKGLQFFKDEKYLDAIEIFKQALDSDEADIEIRNNYVFALAKAKKNADAEKEAGVLLTYAPGRTSAWANLAEIYANKGDTNLASLALIVSFQFSNNKDKTLTFLKEKSEAVDEPAFAESAKLALNKLSNK